MPSPVTAPAGFVPQVALSFADANGASVPVASLNPLPVTFGAVGEMEIRNDVGNPIPVTGSVSLALGAEVEIKNDTGNPVPVSGSITPVYAGSGKVAVSGSVASGAQSGSFSPLAVRDFNVTIGGTGTAQLERQFPGDATWYVVLGDSQRLNLPPSFAWNEPEAAVNYRVNVLSGGPFQVRLSQ